MNPAYGGPEGGEAKVIRQASEFLASHGIASATWDAGPGRPNLAAMLPGSDSSRTLAFITHVDTVSISGMSIDPLGAVVKDGRLWGRGSTDAKGQVTSMLHAFAALAAESAPPPVNIELMLTVDEESGFTGVHAVVERLKEQGRRLDGAVIGEPTDLTVVVAHKGTQRWWIEIEGRAAHSAKPHLGINAIDHAAALVRRIQGPYARSIENRSHPLLGKPTINVSVIEGGTQVNLVPPRAKILLDRRTLPGETRASVEAEFEAIFDEIRCEIPEFRARQLDPLLVDPSLETDPQHALARTACAISAQFGRPSSPLGVPYGTDGSKLSEIGIPTIVAGPGSIDQAHTADEWIEIAELEAGARYYHALMRAGLGA